MNQISESILSVPPRSEGYGAPHRVILGGDGHDVSRSDLEYLLSAVPSAFHGHVMTMHESISSLQDIFVTFWGAFLGGREEILKTSFRSRIAALALAPDRGSRFMAKIAMSTKGTNDLARLNHQCFEYVDSSGEPKQLAYNETYSSDKDEYPSVSNTDYFPKGRHDTWPILVLTSNHATARTLDDVSILMHGWERQYYDSLQGKNGKNIKVISTVFTDPHVMGNGAHLLKRIEHLGNAKDERHLCLDYLTPDSIHLGLIILSKLLRNPTQINLNCTQGLNLPIEKTSGLPNILAEKLDPEKDPLTLRNDAEEVAAHLKLAGFSRSGEVIRGALDYVAYQLLGSEEGKTAASSTPLFKIQDRNGQLRALNKQDVKKIISNIKMLATAPWTEPLSNYEKELGFNRVIIVNKNDILSEEFLSWRFAGSGRHEESDKIIEVDGIKGSQAHNPREALIGVNRDTGYIVRSETALEALQNFFAVSHQRTNDRALGGVEIRSSLV